MHHRLVEVLGGVLDAFGDLALGAPAADRTERVDRVAVRTVLLLEQRNVLRAVVNRADRGGEAGGAGTDHDGVVEAAFLRCLLKRGLTVLRASEGDSR